MVSLPPHLVPVTMRSWLTLLVLLTPVTTVRGQAIAVGDRVKLTAMSYGFHERIGTVRSVSNDRLEFHPSDSTKSVEIGYPAISVLDKSIGRKASIAQGALYGAGAGVLIGGVAGTSCGRSFGGDSCAGPRILAGAGIGLVAGALFGLAVLRTDRWLRIELPTPNRPLGLAATLKF